MIASLVLKLKITLCFRKEVQKSFRKSRKLQKDGSQSTGVTGDSVAECVHTLVPQEAREMSTAVGGWVGGWVGGLGGKAAYLTSHM